MEIQKLLENTNLNFGDMDRNGVSSLANDIFDAYRESVMFGKYKGSVRGAR